MARKNPTPAQLRDDLGRAANDARTNVMAVVGATDLAVERVREAQERLVATAKDLDAKKIQKEMDRIQRELEQLQQRLVKKAHEALEDAKAAPANAMGTGLEIASKAQAAVTELAERGEHVVDRIRTQRPTQDLKHQVESTVAAGKGAVTTARKAAAETSSTARAGAKRTTARVRATTTSARKSAAKASTAAKSAAKKVGD